MKDEEPAPEFRAYLEWQIQTALRRDARFSEPAPRRTGRFRTALAVAAALAIGGAGGLASGYAQESRERGQLIEAARADESLLKLRLDVVKTEVEQARRRVAAGVAEKQTLTAAEDQLRALEAALTRNHLDVEEIQATSAAPRNDLAAPLVGRRDFVRERLMLDVATAQRALAAAEQEAARAKQRFDVGIAEALEKQQADADLAAARARMELLADTLELRRRTLLGELKTDQIAASVRRLELTQQLKQTQQNLDLARERLTAAQRRFAVGTGPELDVMQAQVQILEQQLEMKRLKQQLDTLGVKKE